MSLVLAHEVASHFDVLLSEEPLTLQDVEYALLDALQTLFRIYFQLRLVNALLLKVISILFPLDIQSNFDSEVVICLNQAHSFFLSHALHPKVREKFANFMIGVEDSEIETFEWRLNTKIEA
jgi:hypothetical protein